MQKSIIFCFFLIAFLSTQSPAEAPPDPPQRIVQGQGVIGLDFAAGGNNVQVALFVINVNDTPGVGGVFDVKFEFTNACRFMNGTTLAIPMTDLVWKKLGGTLGTGLTEPANDDIFNNRVSGGTVYYWKPTGTGGQKSATVNYIMELKATWDKPAGVIAGFYYETITATIEMIY
jgi:hypothetical protein